MHSRILLVILSLAFASIAVAQPKAVIDAPKEVASGDLVIFDGSKSTGDNRLWVGDPRVTGRYLVLDDKVVFAIGQPGEYTFQLIVADTTAAIDQVTHTVRVGSPPPIEPPKPPVDPPKPPVDPPPIQSQVEQVSRQSAAVLADPTTAAAMANALSAAIQQSQGQPLESQRAAVRTAIETALLNRTREGHAKDWANGWRRPVDDAIKAAGPTAANYLQLIQQAANGLKTTTTSPQLSSAKPPVISFYTRPGCTWCDKWKADELPQLLAQGVHVIEINTATGAVPRFELCIGNQCMPFQGYTSAGAFVSNMKGQ